MTETEPLLQVKGLKKHFSTTNGIVDKLSGKSESIKAVNGVDFELHAGETIGLVGESGCGKSTLGRTLLQLDEPTEGDIFFQGNNITRIDRKKFKEIRQDMQVIFQDSQSSLNPRKTIGQIVATPLKVQGMFKNNREERVTQLLNDVGLSPRYKNRYVHQISGGERQRVGIARALAVNPEFIICDEPVSALDVSLQAQILNLLINIQEEYDLTLLFISHDISTIRYISDRVFIMYLGEIVEKAPTGELFSNPSHPYTRSLINAVPVPNPKKSERQILEGDVPSPSNPPTGCTFHTRCPEYIGDICKNSIPEKHQIDDDHTARCHLYSEGE